jgi:hypothetical protein
MFPPRVLIGRTVETAFPPLFGGVGRLNFTFTLPLSISILFIKVRKNIFGSEAWASSSIPSVLQYGL